VGRVGRLSVGGAGGLEVRDRRSEVWSVFACSWEKCDSVERASRVVRGLLSKRVWSTGVGGWTWWNSADIGSGRERGSLSMMCGVSWRDDD
jgi:hypothetical protein